MDKEKRLLAKKGKKFYNIELETRRNSSYVWNSYSSYKLHTTLKLKNPKIPWNLYAVVLVFKGHTRMSLQEPHNIRMSCKPKHHRFQPLFGDFFTLKILNFLTWLCKGYGIWSSFHMCPRSPCLNTHVGLMNLWEIRTP